MRIYATEADLAGWLEETPEDSMGAVHGLLRAASVLIEQATVTAFYDADEDGMPTDPDVVAAFRDAACAQAALWLQLGINPALGPAGVTKDPQATTKSIGNASVSYAASSATSRGRNDLVAAATILGAQAAAILTRALPRTRVQVTG